MAERFPETIPDLFEHAARRAPGPWLFFEGDSFTLVDVIDQADRCAVGLAERGVVRGDRVAILSQNRPETLFAWLGANRLGAIAALWNPAFKPAELAGLLRLVRPRVWVVDANWELAEAACLLVDPASRPNVVDSGALRARGAGAPRADVHPDEVAVLIATSGTTGAPKAVMQTHRAYTFTAEAFPFWLGLAPADRLLVALPLFHINAQAYSIMGALGAGAGVALLPRFSASSFWTDARRLGATEINAVGAMLHILLKREPANADREHALRLCYAALALPEESHRAFEARFGVRLIVGYGMSETTFGTVWPLSGAPRYGTIGRLRQHPRLTKINRGRVVRDDGAEAAEGQAGELWLQNPATTPGYWDDPEQTRTALEGGWLHTGDLVKRDRDGFFTFVVRKKDVIRRRGENVSAAEVEGVLASHPSVGEAAVIAEPSEFGEDEIVAFVTAREGATLDLDALRAWAGARLADFKVPGRIVVREALPHTATSRVAKHLLR